VKQLQPDVWDTFFEQHRVGDVIHGKVLRLASFGAFVEIADGVEGLCHNSEAVDSHGAPIKLDAGQEHEFKVIKMNPAEKKVGLSIRAVEKRPRAPMSRPTRPGGEFLLVRQRLYHRRVHVVEARQQRKQLSRDLRTPKLAANDGGFRIFREKIQPAAAALYRKILGKNDTRHYLFRSICRLRFGFRDRRIG